MGRTGRREGEQWNCADKGVPKQARVMEFGNEG